MKRLKVILDKKRSYDIVVGNKLLPRIGNFLNNLNLGNDAVIISNPAIISKYRKPILKGLNSFGFNTYIISIKGSETSKSSTGVVNLIKHIVKIDRGRGIFIAAFGGGMTGDVSGFVASIYKRGVPYIQIPTTLLAQVDSSIGGKTAIDLPSGKNLIGAFYQPRIVISDIHLLKGLNPRIFRSGLGEVIKYGVIKDKSLFEFLEKNIGKILGRDADCLEYIIYRSSAIKARIVQQDEYDKKGIRAQLNYGHTIGHALEAAAGYSKLYYHGEAVGIGMIAAAEIAAKLGVLKKAPLRRIIDLIERSGLPTRISKKLKIDKIMKAQSFDKKIVRGVNRFVLPVKIGEVKLFENIPAKMIRDVIKKRYSA